VDADTSNQAAQTSALVGQAMHRLLQWQAWGDAQIAAVCREFGLTEAAAQQAKALAQTIANGQAAWIWDEAQIDWQANEYELPDPMQAGRWLRIDRLVKHKATQVWWIVDFKSAARPEQLQMLTAQLDRYATALGQSFNVPRDRIETRFATGNGSLFAPAAAGEMSQSDKGVVS
jgi:ATP-dependent helicase/nuclease subunit A